MKTESLGAIMDESIIAFLGGLRTLRARDSSLRITDPDKEVARFRLIHEGQILEDVEVWSTRSEIEQPPADLRALLPAPS